MTTPVSFELAKLLKEKGFDDICYKWYSVQGGLYCQDEFDNCRGFIPAWECEAPTIAEVVMWLYEKHGIWITVYTMDKWSANGNDREQLFDYSLKQMKLGLIDIPKKPEEFNSPTKAYEKAIKYALNNLV